MSKKNNMEQVAQTKANELEAALASVIESAVKLVLSGIERNQDVWFTIEDLCEYLPDKPKKTTIYQWIHYGKIPYHKKGKRIRFLKSEIDEWLKGNL